MNHLTVLKLCQRTCSAKITTTVTKEASSWNFRETWVLLLLLLFVIWYTETLEKVALRTDTQTHALFISVSPSHPLILWQTISVQPSPLSSWNSGPRQCAAPSSSWSFPAGLSIWGKANCRLSSREAAANRCSLAVWCSLSPSFLENSVMKFSCELRFWVRKAISHHPFGGN